MSFMEMSPFAVVAVLVVLVMVAMSSGRIRSGKSSLTGSLSKELRSVGKSIKKSTSGLGKLNGNKMLIGILAGFAICWAYGKFRIDGFDNTAPVGDDRLNQWYDLCDIKATGGDPVSREFTLRELGAAGGIPEGLNRRNATDLFVEANDQLWGGEKPTEIDVMMVAGWCQSHNTVSGPNVRNNQLSRERRRAPPVYTDMMAAAAEASGSQVRALPTQSDGTLQRSLPIAPAQSGGGGL